MKIRNIIRESMSDLHELKMNTMQRYVNAAAYDIGHNSPYGDSDYFVKEMDKKARGIRLATKRMAKKNAKNKEHNDALEKEWKENKKKLGFSNYDYSKRKLSTDDEGRYFYPHVKEENVTESMKLMKTHINGADSAKVYKD